MDLNDVYASGPHFAFTFAGGWRGTPVTPDLQWHHYAVVAQQGQADPGLYIDGVARPVTLRIGNGFISLNPSSQPLHIGAQLDPNFTYFSQTMIDELSIYRRALSAGEIQAIYNAGSSGKCFPPPSLSISLSQQDVTLSWPIWAGNFALQETAGDLSSPASWTLSSSSVVTNNDQLMVALPLNDGARFFRLYQP